MALFGLFLCDGARMGLCAVLRAALADLFRGGVALAGLGATLRDVRSRLETADGALLGPMEISTNNCFYVSDMYILYFDFLNIS